MVASVWPIVLVSLALGVGPLVSLGLGAPSPPVRRAGAVVVLGLALFMVPHAWGHAGLATVPAALLGLWMGYQIHRTTSVGTAATVVGVGLLGVHMVLDGSALAIHDEAAMPWLIGLHRLPAGLAVMAMATARYGETTGRLAGSLVIVGLIALTWVGYGVAHRFVGDGSELLSGLTESFVIGGILHVGLGALPRVREEPPRQ